MNISYEKLNEHSLENLLNNMSRDFAMRESMSKTVRLGSEELYKLFFSVVQNSLEHSFIARNSETNEIVGGLLCNDLNFILNSHFSEETSFELQAIVGLLSKLEENFIGRFPALTMENISLYQYAVYVDEKYTGIGIGTSLCKTSEKSAKLKQFKTIVTIPTGAISQHIYLNKLKFKIIHEIPYEDFKFEGKKIFSGINTPTCMLAMKEL